MLKAASSFVVVFALAFLAKAYRKIIRTEFGCLQPTITRYPPLFSRSSSWQAFFEQAPAKIGFSLSLEYFLYCIEQYRIRDTFLFFRLLELLRDESWSIINVNSLRSASFKKTHAFEWQFQRRDSTSAKT